VANNKKFVTEIETSITYLLFKKIKLKRKNVNKQLICKQEKNKTGNGNKQTRSLH